ncbi:DUF342 domain-containing protein [Mesoaciditoga lauensis]|uniref:DUF342 domain-containing protein n=1 Tax=Mesoaciditoga lauensis TaxID=1495039 RepID=UPI000567A1E1|nr:FapA family protein [Mesoaciditoga lauensis]
MEENKSFQKIEIRVDTNKLNAFVILHSQDVSEEEIYAALKSVGIKFGILKENMSKLMRNPVIEEPVLIAQGIPPVEGKDAFIEYTLKGETKEKRPVMMENGSVDYREIKSYNLVSAGDVLAIKHPATKGKNGTDVFGNEIVAKDGKDVKFFNGKNTKLSPDGTHLMATKSGIPKMGNGIVEVSEVLEIKGDVDYSTGNIDFPGDVYIKGGVKPTFVVKAKGDVRIDGIVEAATIQSEMSVECHGVKGRNKGIISAKKDVRVMFLENATVECRGSLYVRDSIVNSVVRAGNFVEVVEGKGEIISSDIVAKTMIISKQIGSWVSAAAHLEVGVNPELRDKISELSAKIYIDKENLEKVMRLIKVLEELKEKKGSLPPDKEETYTKLKKTQYVLYQGLSKMMAEMKELQKESEIESSKGSVVATSKIYPGLEVKIGNVRLIVEKEMGPTKFVNKDGKIIAIPFTP